MWQLCDKLVSETAHHLLFECNGFQVTREKYWKYVVDEIPPAMMQDVEGMSATRRTEFLLSGLNCDYVPEWANIYKVIADYCYAMYKERRDTTDIV